MYYIFFGPQIKLYLIYQIGLYFYVIIYFINIIQLPLGWNGVIVNRLCDIHKENWILFCCCLCLCLKSINSSLKIRFQIRKFQKCNFQYLQLPHQKNYFNFLGVFWNVQIWTYWILYNFNWGNTKSNYSFNHCISLKYEFYTYLQLPHFMSLG